MSNHTAGPWRAVQHDGLGWFIQFDGQIKDATIAAMNSACLAYDNARADALLIAAAPDLYEACQAAFLLLSEYAPIWAVKVEDQLREALAKARG